MWFKWSIALFNRFPKFVKFLDTTLRDGEQTPGVSIIPEKQTAYCSTPRRARRWFYWSWVAAVFWGWDGICCPNRQTGLRAQVFSAARGTKNDVDAVLKSDASGVAMIIPTSDLHIECKLRKTREQILKTTQDIVLLRKKAWFISWAFAEDATRSDLEYLNPSVPNAVDAGVDRVVPCDTVGILTPERAAEFFTNLKKSIKCSGRCALSQRLWHGSR